MRFNFKRSLCWAACSFLASSASVFAQNHAEPQVDPFPQKLEADLSAGTTAVYMLDFKTARKHFERAIEIDPDHPAAYFFQLMEIWYELTYDSLANRNSQTEKILEYQAELASRKAEAYTKNPKTAAVGYLYWGGAQGAKGWYHVTRSNWIRAYFAGKKGYAYMQKVLEIDPKLTDAYLGVGMYEYYAATLGPTLKALASFAISGDKAEAVRDLTIAQTQSRFVRFEAAYFLWNAYAMEGNHEEAHRRALELKKSFPESPLFRWCEVCVLLQEKKWHDALKVCEEYSALTFSGPQDENARNPFHKLLTKIYYHAGLAAYNLGDIQRAKTYFDKTIDQECEFQGWKVLAYLRRGEIFDIENKRMEAQAKYRAVLKYPDVYDSHKIARRRIRKSYKDEQETEWSSPALVP